MVHNNPGPTDNMRWNRTSRLPSEYAVNVEKQAVSPCLRAVHAILVFLDVLFATEGKCGRGDVMPGLERLLDLGNHRGVEGHVPHGRRLAFFGTQTHNLHEERDHAVRAPAEVKEIPLPIIGVR